MSFFDYSISSLRCSLTPQTTEVLNPETLRWLDKWEPGAPPPNECKRLSSPDMRKTKRPKYTHEELGSLPFCPVKKQEKRLRNENETPAKKRNWTKLEEKKEVPSDEIQTKTREKPDPTARYLSPLRHRTVHSMDETPPNYPRLGDELQAPERKRIKQEESTDEASSFDWSQFQEALKKTTIRDIKKEGMLPFVKLRTYNEADPRSIVVTPHIVSQNSYFCTLQRACAGTLHFAGNTIHQSGWQNSIKSWSFGYIDPWNCNRMMTALALKTSIAVLRQDVEGLQEELKKDLSHPEWKELKLQIEKNIETLRSAKKTLFYIYKTYTQEGMENREEETIENAGDGPLEIFEQDQNLGHLIEEELVGVLSQIDRKITPPVSDQPLTPTPGKQALVFESHERASAWFLKRIAIARQDVQNKKGASVHKDLMSAHRIAGRIPQPFTEFAKSIDATFKSKIEGYAFIRRTYPRFLEQLQAEGLEIPQNHPPDTFKGWLGTMCKQSASQRAYQILFETLMNSSKTAPYDLRFEPAILNAILSSQNYFPLFDF
ncbi:MAG: hypothetical protein HYZ48_01835 [Chlamydiales bacterium]|nr:hypothetical protein [Chlamydiales bacterium]